MFTKIDNNAFFLFKFLFSADFKKYFTIVLFMKEVHNKNAA